MQYTWLDAISHWYTQQRVHQVQSSYYILCVGPSARPSDAWVWAHEVVGGVWARRPHKQMHYYHTIITITLALQIVQIGPLLTWLDR